MSDVTIPARWRLIAYAVLLCALTAAVRPSLTHAGSLTPSIVTVDSPYRPWGVASAPDGTVWMLATLGAKVGSDAAVVRIRPGKKQERVATLPGTSPCGSDPSGPAVAPDGGVWIGCRRAIVHVSPAGVVESFPTGDGGAGEPTLGADGTPYYGYDHWNVAHRTASGQQEVLRLVPWGCPGFRMTLGPDGNIWFVGSELPYIGKITPAGEVIHVAGYNETDPDAAPSGYPGADFAGVDIATGSDGAVWVLGESSLKRIQMDGTITTTSLAKSLGSKLHGSELTAGPDGNLWMPLSTNGSGSSPSWDQPPGAQIPRPAHDDAVGPRVARIRTDGTIEVLASGTVENLHHFTPGNAGTLWAIQEVSCRSDAPKHGFGSGQLVQLKLPDAGSGGSTLTRGQALTASGCRWQYALRASFLTRSVSAGGVVKLSIADGAGGFEMEFRRELNGRPVQVRALRVKRGVSAYSVPTTGLAPSRYRVSLWQVSKKYRFKVADGFVTVR